MWTDSSKPLVPAGKSYAELLKKQQVLNGDCPKHLEHGVLELVERVYWTTQRNGTEVLRHVWECPNCHHKVAIELYADTLQYPCHLCLGCSMPVTHQPVTQVIHTRAIHTNPAWNSH
jgi:hypothetical protein